MRVFLDANILFSAAKSAGSVRELLRIIQDAGHECCVDEYVIFEARRNLVAKGPEALGMLDCLLETCRRSPAQALGTTATREEVGWLPEKDRPVLTAVIHLRCDALLTGDRTHFGPKYGKSFAGVVIHSPRSLAEVLLA